MKAMLLEMVRFTWQTEDTAHHQQNPATVDNL
jgi:hypothetical protein